MTENRFQKSLDSVKVIALNPVTSERIRKQYPKFIILTQDELTIREPQMGGGLAEFDLDGNKHRFPSTHAIYVHMSNSP
jgi:hypothetical protein